MYIEGNEGEGMEREGGNGGGGGAKQKWSSRHLQFLNISHVKKISSAD